jgi:hypothetical protein
MTQKSRLILLAALFFCMFLPARAQRNYAPNSVLASGNWYKFSVNQTGVYKLDIPFLNSLGVTTTNLASTSLKLFGKSGGMLSESNAGVYTDDLVETAIQIVDGGDGFINGADYILFYATGPDLWKNDSINQRLTHVKKLYSDKSF